MSDQDVVKLLIRIIGDDPESEHLAKTPERVLKSFKDLYSGYGKTAADALGTSFSTDGYDQLVMCKDIEFYSTCAHHMLPFVGKAHVGYIPDQRIVGLSKLARLVEVFSRRLQVQERITSQVANALYSCDLKPKGVMVVIEAKHFCMCARGVAKQSSLMVTSAVLGAFMDNSAARAEFMSLLKP